MNLGWGTGRGPGRCRNRTACGDARAWSRSRPPPTSSIRTGSYHARAAASGGVHGSHRRARTIPAGPSSDEARRGFENTDDVLGAGDRHDAARLPPRSGDRPSRRRAATGGTMDGRASARVSDCASSTSREPRPSTRSATTRTTARTATAPPTPSELSGTLFLTTGLGADERRRRRARHRSSPTHAGATTPSAVRAAPSRTRAGSAVTPDSCTTAATTS